MPKRELRVGAGLDHEQVGEAIAHAVGAGASEEAPWTVYVVGVAYAAGETKIAHAPGVHVVMEGMPG